jgi:hypothetical protein
MQHFSFKLSILLVFFTNFLFAQHPKVSFSEEPNWARVQNLSSYDSLETDGSAGFYYLLVDQQDFLETEQYYSHFTYKILNSKGVQEMSSITIDFDPEYQKVQLHGIEIIRNGKTMDRLDWGNLQVIQREMGMEDYLYDGALTITANLPDVRVGDIIDYSFTIAGDNPVHQSKYQSAFDLQYTFPIHFFRYMVFVPDGEKIAYKKFNGAQEPEIREQNGAKTYIWKKRDLKPIVYEANTPAWYNAAPYIQVSQFGSWGKIVSRYEGMYALSPAERRELKQAVSEFIENGEDKKVFIANAIRFVQDEIRYLGFENGLNSHVPTSPVKILNQRYGDCKDKSFLLCEILRSHDIEAYPVLVNSYNGKNLPQSLPFPNAFDHCVVRIDFGDEGHKYIDPTYGNQGGGFEGTYFPNYGHGLVIKPGENQLTALPAPPESKVEITQTFILDSIGGGGTMKVESLYWGNNSDYQRQQFANTSLEVLQNSYLHYYSELYPSIKTEEEMRYEDYRKRNQFKVVEKYRIEDFWTSSFVDKNVIYVEFQPLTLSPFLYPTQSSTRKMPYYIGPRQSLTHKTVVYVPEAWSIQNESYDFGGKNFRYSYDTRYKNAKLEITRKYNSNKAFLKAGEVPGYLAEHAKAQETYSYMLTYNKKLGAVAGQSTFSWLTILLILAVMGAMAFVCFWLYRNYDLPTNVEPKYQRKIGGWLILVSIGLALTPFFLLFQFFTPEFYDRSLWTTLLLGGEQWALSVFVFALLIFHSAFFIFSIFVAIIFFQRRTIAPKMVIWFYAVNLVSTGIIVFIALRGFPEIYKGPLEQDMIMELVRAVLAALIWIPYFIFSERVEETFVKTKRKQGETEEVVDVVGAS